MALILLVEINSQVQMYWDGPGPVYNLDRLVTEVVQY